jgi:hypothetical protein
VLWDSAEEDAALESRLKRSLLEEIQSGATQAWKEHSPKNSTQPALDTESLWQERRENLQRINEQTIERLLDALYPGIGADRSDAALAGRIKALFREAHDIRAISIAESLSEDAWEQGAHAIRRILQIENPTLD